MTDTLPVDATALALYRDALNTALDEDQSPDSPFTLSALLRFYSGWDDGLVVAGEFMGSAFSDRDLIGVLIDEIQRLRGDARHAQEPPQADTATFLPGVGKHRGEELRNAHTGDEGES